MSRLKSVPPDSLFLFLALYGGGYPTAKSSDFLEFSERKQCYATIFIHSSKKTFDSNTQDLNNIGLRIQNVKFEICKGCFKNYSCVIQNWIKDIFDLLLILQPIFQKKNNNLFVFLCNSKLSCNCIPFYYQLKKGTN